MTDFENKATLQLERGIDTARDRFIGSGGINSALQFIAPRCG
jgi:hypothetical protein